MNDKLTNGFVYTIETIKDGTVVDTEIVHNLMPYEGMNHVLNTVLKGGTQVGTWYVGIFEGNYTPVSSDTMATFPTYATESTAYNETSRVQLVLGTPSNGSIDNTASKAEFTMNATKTIYGGFISSASTKGGTSGTLLSAVRFSSAKSVDNTTVLRITASISLT